MIHFVINSYHHAVPPLRLCIFTWVQTKNKLWLQTSCPATHHDQELCFAENSENEQQHPIKKKSAINNKRTSPVSTDFRRPIMTKQEKPTREGNSEGQCSVWVWGEVKQTDVGVWWTLPSLWLPQCMSMYVREPESNICQEDLPAPASLTGLLQHFLCQTAAWEDKWTTDLCCYWLNINVHLL